ncbi:class I SAM-dependent methyltransferase [Frankia sp. AgB32]|uniref:class I SAM-dependent DNA methyltransferase n=1 Tax=Frankia sp. AgB32 TaxID=631119 RepID=UPI00200D54BD|nr:class I SAM-dependent methyltransferase [Frankia sp. AgB32]MCK9892989.1 class I SAM-dependent methyltransferase [Frankia sp. AgB32]
MDSGFLGSEVYGDTIADVYDDWFSGSDRQVAIDAAADFLHASAGAGPALELGIGTGRVALPLAARGTKVAGIDASTRMTARLREKPGGSDIDVKLADFAEIGFPAESFGLVYVVFNTFCVLPDQDAQVRCFSEVADVLWPGGSFVMENFVPDPTRFDRGQRVEVERVLGDATHLHAAVHDPVEQRVRSRRLVFGSDGVRTFPVELRYAWPSELDLMGRLAGLTLAERWAGWTREPFTGSSPSHVSVWRKP